MSTFEYLGIAFSLILSFAAMRIVEGLPAAAEPRRRYWVHLSLVLLHLIAILGLFWAFLAFRDVTWTFPTFVLVLFGPSVYYFVSCTLIPRDAGEVVSWQEHFFSIRRRFWLAILLYASSVQVVFTMLLDTPWSDASRVPSGAAIVLSTVGAASPNERVQEILAVVVWLAFASAVVAVGPLSEPAA